MPIFGRVGVVFLVSTTFHLPAESIAQSLTGPLACSRLGSQNCSRTVPYSPSAVRLRLWLLNQVSRWLEEEEQLTPAELTADVCA
jgi:hypothetical protein